jgi:hypothetical protein
MAGVVKKPDAADREGMPLTCSTLSDETQCLAKAVDPGKRETGGGGGGR